MTAESETPADPLGLFSDYRPCQPGSGYHLIVRSGAAERTPLETSRTVCVVRLPKNSWCSCCSLPLMKWRQGGGESCYGSGSCGESAARIG